MMRGAHDPIIVEPVPPSATTYGEVWEKLRRELGNDSNVKISVGERVGNPPIQNPDALTPNFGRRGDRR